MVDFSLPEYEFLAMWPEAKRWSRLQQDPALFPRMEREARKEAEHIIMASGYPDPDKLRGNEYIKSLTGWALAVQFALNGYAPNGWNAPSWHDKVELRLHQKANDLLGGRIKLPYDSDEDGVISDEDRAVQPVDLER